VRETATTCDKGHGRVERRTLTSTTDLNAFLDWPGLQQVCRIQRERVIGGHRACEMVYYLTSLPRSRVGPDHLLELVRGHWGAIENRLHYVRDVALGEDASTIRTGHAPQNLATLRNTALNWLRLAGRHQITAALRNFARNPLRLFTHLGYRN
jgi:hypothetical protein